MANKNGKKEAVMFWADPEALRALRIVTKTLGRGNKSDGIRRALIETAERIETQRTITADKSGNCPEAA
jgi:hypothetical protein